MLTPHCSAASGIVVPPSIVSTTRLRKSAEYGFAIHAGLLPAGSLNHIRAAMGIPDSAFPGNALMVSADCETTLEIVPASLTGTSKLRPQLPPSWGRNRPSRETFWPSGHLGKLILRAGGWSGSDAARNESGRPSIEVLEVTLGDMQN